MKSYMLFSGFRGYPNGGWLDFVGDFDTLEEAENRVRGISDWFQIVDSKTMKVVKTYKLQHEMMF